MRRNVPKFIQALRSAATSLEKNPNEYKWTDELSCNCGTVIKHLVGGKNNLRKLINNGTHGCSIRAADMIGTWTHNANKALCGTTNLPLRSVFLGLIEKGFMRGDFKHLEYLSNPTICERAGLAIPERNVSQISRFHFSDPHNVVKYLRAWADILCEKQCKRTKKELQHA